MKALHALLLVAMIIASGRAAAVIETYEFSSPELAARYKRLSAELRCPKCQNQNIADSNAPISQDLRRLLHQQLEAGASDAEILDYMVARYGEFVRYRPRFSGPTSILWLAPALFLLAAIGVVTLMLRSRRDAAGGSVELNAREEEQLQALLDQNQATKAESDS